MTLDFSPCLQKLHSLKLLWTQVTDFWYLLTAPSSTQQDTYQETLYVIRRGRLISAVLFVEMFLVVVAIPEAFVSPGHWTVFILLAVLATQTLACTANRVGKNVLAGILCVASIEAGLFSAILSTPGGLGVISLLQIALLVQAVCASVSILPPISAFLVAAINSAFAFSVLSFLPIQPELVPVLAAQRSTVTISVVSIQVIVATVTYLWVRSTTRAETQERLLTNIASTDAVTNLPNHRAVMSRIDEELARCTRTSASCAILFLDLDHFKRINDTWGHRAGDAILYEVATRLRTTLRLEDFVGRYGGEEFAVVLTNADLQGASETSERLRLALFEKPCTWLAEDGTTNITIPVTASIGVAVYGIHGATREELVQSADHAMYQAKQQGRNRVWIDTSKEEQRVHNLLAI